MERFTGKVAVVTGCSGGIGSAICKELIKRDIIVAGLGRTPEKLEVSEEMLNDLPHTCHVFIRTFCLEIS